MMHLKDKRIFTLLVASNPDYISANLILNQHHGVFNVQNIRQHEYYTIICVVIVISYIYCMLLYYVALSYCYCSLFLIIVIYEHEKC